MNYQVVGWFVTSANIGFLIPITLINLAALVALLLAVIMAKSGSHRLPPSEPRKVTYHEDTNQKDQIPDEWRHKVTFQPTTVHYCDLSRMSSLNAQLRFLGLEGIF